jgi:succinyl-diaminopimelate desuccinylase
MSDELFAYMDAQSERVIAWQREMTARAALGPENNGEGELDKAEWLQAELAAIGASDIRRHDCPDDRVPSGLRPNISARVPGRSPRTLWVIGHMDVVPPGDLALWSGDPFTLRVEGDRIYGRGVEDDQQAIASGLLAAQALVEKQIVPELSLGLLFVADEETGMERGLPYVLDKAPELFRPDDMFLVPDMGVSDGSMVEIAEKSCLWLRFTVLGKQCHASTPDAGINSLVAASACILEMNKLYSYFPIKDPLYSPAWSTFVPSKKEANVENINTLPGRDVFYLDCRILPEYSMDSVLERVRAIADEVAGSYSVSIAVDVVHDKQGPSPTPADAPVVRSLCEALTEVRGVTPKICGSGGQTVAACLRQKGMETAVWATLVPNPHSPNEYSSIKATIADSKIMAYMLRHPA